MQIHESQVIGALHTPHAITILINHTMSPAYKSSKMVLGKFTVYLIINKVYNNRISTAW
jgi:hypothetical protein